MLSDDDIWRVERETASVGRSYAAGRGGALSPVRGGGVTHAPGRGLRAAALLGVVLVAVFAAAPAAAQHLLQPVVTSSPASGSTYLPGETITVQVRPRTAPWVAITSGPNNLRLGLTVGSIVKQMTGSVQGRRYSYTVYDHEQRRNVTRWRNTNVLEFNYTVQKGDRDTDGVSVTANSMSGGNIGANVGGSDFGGGDWYPSINKNHSALSAQSSHKVDTPAPTFSGVTGPSVTFYAGASVNYRLPQVANADAAHNVTYSVTPWSISPYTPLPTGYSLNASTATITGSYGSASSGWTTHRLRATDAFNRTADLSFRLRINAGAGIETIAITSNPGADKTYGKVAPFGTNDNITVRVDFTHRLTLVRSGVCLRIQIGSNRRTACNPGYSTSDSSRWDKIDFTYAVQASDWDDDGISFPANPLGGGGKTTNLRFHRTGGSADNRVNVDFGSIPDDPNHKVRGQQTTPGFGSTASPAYSWVRGNAVSQALPAATGGDGGVTYTVGGSLPAGLSFAAATRTISGTPTAAQGRTNYTLTATDGDGDSGTLRFSIEVQEITASISSPGVTEGAAGGTATLEYDVTLNRAPGRQVTVAYAAAADPGTASSGTDYTAISGGTLTFGAAETSKSFEVAVTGDALDEPNETVRVALSNPTGAVLGSAAVGVGTITDDDPTPTLALSLSEPDAGTPDTIAESGAGNATTVTASLSGGISGEAITVTVSATGATAAAGDFSLSSDKTLTIAAGATTSSGTVTVTSVDDATDEPDETATVGGDGGGRARSGGGAFGPDVDHRRRRCPAALVAGADSGVDHGVGRGFDGYGDALEPLGRGGDAHGVGGGGASGDVGGLHVEPGGHIDDRGGGDDEHGDGDGDGCRQRDRRGGQERDGFGFGVGGARARGGGPGGRDVDDPRRRRRADGGAGAVVVVGFGEWRGRDGYGGAFGGVERGGYGDGGGGGGSGRGRCGLHVEPGGHIDDRGGGDDEHGLCDGDGERQRGGFSGQVGDGFGLGVGGPRDRVPGERYADARR